jgi:hypothetical protein
MKRIVALCVVLLLLASCGASARQPAPIEQYRTGSDALVISQTKNLPSTLYANENYVLALKLQNKGATEIRDGRLLIITDESLVQLSEDASASRNIRSIEGKSSDYPQGETQIVTIPFSTNALPVESQKQPLDIVVQACYRYQTVHTFDFCMDTDPYSERATKPVCTSKPVSVRPSGGPLSVSSVDVDIIPDGDEIDVSFTFTIKKPAQGLVFGPGEESSVCSSRGAMPKQAVRLLAYYSTSSLPLVCENDGLVFFSPDGDARITCTLYDPLLRSSTESFLTSLSVTLDYGHISMYTASFSIVR